VQNLESESWSSEELRTLLCTACRDNGLLSARFGTEHSGGNMELSLGAAVEATSLTSPMGEYAELPEKADRKNTQDRHHEGH
jgi:hypothetical protein